MEIIINLVFASLIIALQMPFFVLGIVVALIVDGINEGYVLTTKALGNVLKED